MKPGRKLDVLVIEQVMGKQVNAQTGTLFLEIGFGFYRDFSPSTDTGDAWKVMEKLQDLNDHVWLDWNRNPGQVGQPNSYNCWYRNKKGEDGAFGETAPHAICLAALKAVGYEI